MPLNKGKSKAAFSQNVRTEMNAGKPKNQALAIAYATKRKARKMSSGGMVNDEGSSDEVEMVPDNNDFLSDEGRLTPFHSNPSDEDSLTHTGFLPEAQMDNEEGNEDQSEARSSTISDIMRKVRMRNMGR